MNHPAISHLSSFSNEARLPKAEFFFGFPVRIPARTSTNKKQEEVFRAKRRVERDPHSTHHSPPNLGEKMRLTLRTMLAYLDDILELTTSASDVVFLQHPAKRTWLSTNSVYPYYNHGCRLLQKSRHSLPHHLTCPKFHIQTGLVPTTSTD